MQTAYDQPCPICGSRRTYFVDSPARASEDYPLPRKYFINCLTCDYWTPAADSRARAMTLFANGPVRVNVRASTPVRPPFAPVRRKEHIHA